jgi:FtsP/CotA-like multicopper oxidase with cupredoxin domain
MNRNIRIALALASLVGIAIAAAPRHTVDRVEPNDNRLPAGRLVDGVLTLHLEVRRGEWFPESADGPSVVVPVFAEEGRAPQVPGPLIRVPAGTLLDITVTNQLGDTGVTIFGLTERPATGPDSVRLAPGAVHHFRFRAGTPGTYLYGGRTETQPFVLFETQEESQLSGAIVVDPAGRVPDDRVFVMTIWAQPDDTTGDSTRVVRNVLAINGLSWPYTERMPFTVGDSAHWRVINASRRIHPMHLHGFYYRVTALGTLAHDSTYLPEDERLVVTESMLPLSTMSMAFQARAEGNWLFHCHIIFHAGPGAALTWPDGTMPGMSDSMPHMAGLILGLVVAPRPGSAAPPRKHPATYRLVVRQAPRPGGPTGFVMSYALGDGAEAGPVTLPAPLLLLTRGVPTDVTVVNHLDFPTGVHWHGLELESASDGVAGWSQTGDRRFQPIQPGDSFVAHLTQPRAGTFIYHTHFHDVTQLLSGLYGPIVVLEPGVAFDPRTDHLFLLGRDGELGQFLLNGDSLPPDMSWTAGTTQRLRLINIMPFGRFTWRLLRGDSTAAWRAVARDGADLPRSQQTVGAAIAVIDAGETADFELLRPAAGRYRLELGPAKGPEIVQRIRIGPPGPPLGKP